MLVKIFFSIVCVLFFLRRTSRNVTNFCMADESNLTLVFANVLYRHGDRTPVSTYPKDPYGNLSYWPAAWGQLTNIGKEQHYELGQWLRNRYRGFLPDIYSPDDIHVHSTDIDRTLMSAACNLAGLYPATGKQKWNPKMPWQPIPIHTVPEKEDEILAGKKHCPVYDAELERFKSSPEMKKYNEDHSDLYKYVSVNTGSNIQEPKLLEYVYDTLFIEELYNYTLPEWTKKVYPHEMKPVAEFSFMVPVKTKLLQRLKIGPLLGTMVNHMKDKQEGNMTPNCKMKVYSAHDVTIANLLMAMGVFDPQNPPYRSLVLVELWKDIMGKHYVLVSYRNSTKIDPYSLTIPGCETLCPLHKFADLLSPVIPVSWEKECKLGIFYEDFSFNYLSIIALLISGILAILLILSMIFGITYWKKQHSSNYFYHRLQPDFN